MPSPNLNLNAIIRQPTVTRHRWTRWGLAYLVAYVAMTLTCAVAYRIASSCDSGLKLSYNDKATPGFADCVYFSVVTISSLGYGDIRPIGCGRIIAGVEVTTGLVILGLWISRLASRRVEILTERLHGYAADERFKQFRQNIARLSEEFLERATRRAVPMPDDAVRLWSTGKESEDAALDELDATVGGIVRHLRHVVSQGDFFESPPQKFIGRLIGACVDSVSVLDAASNRGAVLDATCGQATGNVNRLKQVLHDYQVLADCMLHNSPHEEHRVAARQLMAEVAKLNR